MSKLLIPNIVVGRLPIYLRALQRMAQENLIVTSSKELGERLEMPAVQIRKDLSQFGEFGKQGTGYKIEFLIQHLEKILHVDNEWEVTVIGAGDIGSAIARYNGFTNRGFTVKLIFDNNAEKINTQIGTLTVKDSAGMVEIIQKAGIKIAMICVPAEEAQYVAEQLIEAGIKGILNYASININTPKDVFLEFIDPSIHLQRMTYYID